MLRRRQSMPEKKKKKKNRGKDDIQIIFARTKGLSRMESLADNFNSTPRRKTTLQNFFFLLRLFLAILPNKKIQIADRNL